MAWSIAEVARMSGVTSRTLRHYDEIGLLAPDRVGTNGYRYYEVDQLLRLQQILVLRRLDLGLPQIAEVLGRQTDQVEALRGHLKQLLLEQDRLGAVIATVVRTISELETTQGGPTMAAINRPENLFEGFDATQYDAEARERWPQNHGKAQKFAATLTPEDTERMQKEGTAAMIRMAEFMIAGVPADDPTVLDEVEHQYRGICNFWTPDAAAYRNLGQMYVDDERFKVNYERITPGLAEYQRDAMAAYADARLS
ncbi:MerR family transcriptional regulator [Streptomyces sp. NPDC005574]|uniref:MerR family transcriptional regulator n=1 Tax=Streptomyces sp. NPDC005574 TaxID=3156891 RepID=UPI0033A0FCBB